MLAQDDGGRCGQKKTTRRDYCGSNENENEKRREKKSRSARTILLNSNVVSSSAIAACILRVSPESALDFDSSLHPLLLVCFPPQQAQRERERSAILTHQHQRDSAAHSSDIFS